MLKFQKLYSSCAGFYLRRVQKREFAVFSAVSSGLPKGLDCVSLLCSVFGIVGV
ncbi:hypothetical protein APHCR_0425 [Anaplasma phagocytophilum str. CR1007]|nr:hypothetical protein WSQ_04265 [Anaplasma phagocytophilum str. JM]AGR82068.1 hypothetical protein YYY_04260 [Anaplasma phagocytophilum str. Dog2]EOA61176.1 hypothetical protein HGE1_03952 [Anaplasma phagocytophilum str. HGE1]KJV83265.1 hypothetical protein APHHGE2_1235 [Anaplasma phagocytophilum str. HGE2]KJZ98683.1 hypothetical protein APHCR_0425 [Anaplasma phagocytophilum str. CR1007]